jgi:hypothetical protein
MRLIDRIIQCRTPFVVENLLNGSHTRLSGAMDGAMDLERCPIRYVLDDALISLCTDLAYSHGTTVMDCADLIRVPAQNTWVEWCNKPWQHALNRNGLDGEPSDGPPAGHYGVHTRASGDGRRGVMRAFWSVGDHELDVHASSTQARFYLDDAGAPLLPDEPAVLRVAARELDPEAILGRCFHFEFEDSWARYYREAAPSAPQQQEILHRSIGVVALAVPALLAFFLLLTTRAGLPQYQSQLQRLNRDRIQRGRAPLADHIKVSVPLLPPYREAQTEAASAGARRHPRLHHVRGHLVRRNDRLIWRVPHLRGRSQAGTLKSRTVEWRFEAGNAQGAERSSRGSTP